MYAHISPNHKDVMEGDGKLNGNSSKTDYYTDKFISQMMLRAEHPELASDNDSGTSYIEKPQTSQNGLIINFENDLNQLKTEKPNIYREYSLLIDNFKDNLREINELEQNLIRRHFRSGKYLNEIKKWFELTFDTAHHWANFVPYLLDQIHAPNYNIRTAQRDMMLYRNLGAYEDLLVSAGNSGLAISTIYLLSNPDQVSDFALDWAMGLIQDQVVTSGQQKVTIQTELDKQPGQFIAMPSVLPMPGIPNSVIPNSSLNLGQIDLSPRARLANTKQQLTLKQAKKIAETAAVIENEIDPKKRPLVKSIASTHQVVSPDMIRELAKQDDETLQEIHATGHIEYPVEADGVVEQRNIHVSEASVTDVLMMRGEIDDEKHKRHLQHRIDAAKEKELLTKGIVSEKVNTMDMDNIAESQHQRIAAFIQQNPDLRDTLLPLMNNIRSAQGSAGVRVIICRLDYASLGSSSANEIKN